MTHRGIVWWIESGGHLAELGDDGRAWCSCGRMWPRLPAILVRATLEQHVQHAPLVPPRSRRPAP